MIGTIQLSDLKIGMYLKDTGPGTITVYENADTTSNAMVTIQPGSLIGQIHDFKYSNGEEWVIVTSADITAAEPWYSKAAGVTQTITLGFLDPFWWADSTRNTNNWGLYGAVRLADIQANVSDAEVKGQNDLIAANADSASSLTNNIKSLAKGTGQVVAAAVKGAAEGLGISGWGFVALILGAAYLSRSK
jgi:hypothetical protein